MGMSPCMYISATFYIGLEDTPEIIEAMENDSSDFMVAREDSGIDGTNWSKGYITVYTFFTNGWCESVTLDELKDKNDEFVTYMQDFCLERKYKEPSFLYGATYWQKLNEDYYQCKATTQPPGRTNSTA